MNDSIDTSTLRRILKSQYHAGLAMLREAIQLCPDELWLQPQQRNAFWQVAYHALFFTHLYLHSEHTLFRPWAEHQSANQNPDGIPGTPDPESTLPLIPEPYARAQALAYWDVCNQMVDSAVDALDLQALECGFPWYKMSKLEHQLVNLRHLQHHGAQLADRLRTSLDVGVRWVGGDKRPQASA
jgi:hypothetical protein